MNIFSINEIAVNKIKSFDWTDHLNLLLCSARFPWLLQIECTNFVNPTKSHVQKNVLKDDSVAPLWLFRTPG